MCKFLYLEASYSLFNHFSLDILFIFLFGIGGEGVKGIWMGSRLKSINLQRFFSRPTVRAMLKVPGSQSSNCVLFYESFHYLV